MRYFSARLGNLNVTMGAFTVLTLLTLACMFATGSACSVLLVDAHHNFSTLSTEPGLFCWNITTLDETLLALTCQCSSLFCYIRLHIPVLNGHTYLLWIYIISTDTSDSCEVYSVSDTIESICGPADIQLTSEYHLSMSIPFNLLRAQCHWRVTRPPGTIIYLDLLNLDLRRNQELAFGRGLINDNSSTLRMEINYFNYVIENGSSYFFFEPHIWVSYSSRLPLLYDISTDATTQILRLRLQNYSSQKDVKCDDEYALCSRDSKCIPQSSLCDGFALCSDFADEAGNCNHCGTSNRILVSLNEPVTIIGNFSRVEGSLSHSGYFAVIYGATVTTPNATLPPASITTHHVELVHEYECVWHLTEPPGTRLRAEVLEFEAVRLKLSIGSGDLITGVPDLVATKTIHGRRQVLSSYARMWVTLERVWFGAYLKQLQIVFNTYSITDCDRDSFSCPSGQGCLANSSHVCDGIRECPAYGDELGCGVCEKDYFQCTSAGNCIPKYKLCDRRAHCTDHTDEYLCGFCGNETIRTIPHQKYQLEHSDPNTDCLWVISSDPGTRLRVTILAYEAICQVIFGSNYQTSAEGEEVFEIRTVDNRRRKTAYPSVITSNASTLWITKKCRREGLVKIEISQYTDVECQPNESQCPSGLACISPSAKCDGETDCPEGWDEVGCGSCGEDEMSCRFVTDCVSRRRICDGNVDCKDYSDEFNCEPCGESVINLQQDVPVTINSLGWPNDSYQNNLRCLWMIAAREGYRVFLNFTEFLLEEGYDFLRIGNRFNYSFLNLTGKFFPVSVTSSVNTMCVMFTSDFTVTHIGFSLQLQQLPANVKVSCAEGEIACSGTTRDSVCVRNDTSERGRPVCAHDKCGRRQWFIWNTNYRRFSFPRIRKTHYPNDIDCFWEFIVKKPKSLLVWIRNFQTERSRDKLSLHGSTLHGGEAMRFEFHGTTKIQTVVFNQSIVMAKFASDSSVSKSGFRLELFGNFSATNETSCPDSNLFDCGDGSCVSHDARCDGFVDCQTEDLDERDCESVSCPGFYHCDNSTKCISWDMVCDDKQDCPLEDDESDLQCLSRCPSDCSCTISSNMLDVTCKDKWNQSTLSGIPTRTKILSLSDGNMTIPDAGLFKAFSFLRILSLVDNNIKSIAPGTFYGLQNLTVLNISDNPIATLYFHSFLQLQSLQIISIRGVPLTTIQRGAFDGLRQLNTMIITRNSSASQVPIDVQKNALNDLLNLEEFYAPRYLSDLLNVRVSGRFTRLAQDTLRLNCSQTKLVSAGERMFSVAGHRLLNQLGIEVRYVDDYRLCCEFISAINFSSSNCVTTETQPPLNLCGSLMQNDLLRVCIWCLGFSAFIGNAIVIIWRCCQDSGKGEKKTHSFFVLNLAASDLMMGVYMVIIASADTYYGESYSRAAFKWRSNVICRIAGILSMLSSEASVFFITLISIDCFISIVFPFSRVRISEKTATVLVSIIWVLTICLSVGPTILANSESDFYGLSDVCIGLPLTTVPVTYINKEYTIGSQVKPDIISISLGQGKQPAWQYSIILFLGVNSVCFIIVLCCYITIFAKVKRTAKLVRKAAHRKREMKMAVKMALIVGTDFACWMPVIILGILSQTGILDIGPDIYAWVVVFVLPINSSLNPYLYTLYTMIVTYRNEQSLNLLKSRFTTEKKTMETLHSSAM